MPLSVMGKRTPRCGLEEAPAGIEKMSRDRVTLDAVSPVLDLVGDWFALGLTEMMVRISCPCGHVGVVCAVIGAAIFVLAETYLQSLMA